MRSPELRASILNFYSELSVPIETKKDRIRLQSTELDQWKATAPLQAVAGGLAQ